MNPRARWSRRLGATGILLAIGAVGGLVATYQAARDRERQAADLGIATAIAGYLSLVTPGEPNSSDYQLAALLSASHTLDRTVGGRSGMQVAWRNTPLLKDSIGLTPLEPAVVRLLSDGYATARVDRDAGTVSLAPLFDRDQWNTVGWVGFWGAVIPSPPSPVTLALALVMVVAIVMALHLARPGESSRHRWTSAGIAVLAMLVLAYRLGSEVENLAARSTNAVLLLISFQYNTAHRPSVTTTGSR
jgi:hypothetical protein